MLVLLPSFREAPLIPVGSEVTLDKFSSLEAGFDALGTGLG